MNVSKRGVCVLYNLTAMRAYAISDHEMAIAVREGDQDCFGFLTLELSVYFVYCLAHMRSRGYQILPPKGSCN